MRDIYVIHYGSKYGWKFETGIVQKLCDSKEECIQDAKRIAKQNGGSVFLEGRPGKFKKIK